MVQVQGKKNWQKNYTDLVVHNADKSRSHFELRRLLQSIAGKEFCLFAPFVS